MGIKQVFTREATGLVRELSASDVLMYNILIMGLGWPVVFIFFAASAYPTADLPICVLIGFFPNVIIALLYYYLSVAMPRTGGDYVWCSRVVHPAIGFMESFGCVVFWLSYSGFIDSYFMNYGVAGILANLAVSAHQTYLASLASFLSGWWPTFMGSLLVVAIVVGFTAISLRNTFRFEWACFIVMVIGVAVFLIALGTSSPEIFKNNFNSLSGLNYDEIISAAHNAGLPTGVTGLGTLVGTLYAFTMYIGFATSSYLGGEVKQVHRSQFIGIVLSCFVFGAIVYAMWATVWWIMGGAFYSAISQLASTGNSAYTLPIAPVASYLVIFANSSPIVGVLVPLAVIAVCIGSQNTVVLFCVRILFSWSFDGITPAKLASLSERTKSPNYALAVVAVIMTVYVLLTNVAASILTFFAYTTSGIYLAIIAVGVAGVMLPYRHKDVFNISPANVQQKLAGIPIVTILGVLTIIIGIFVAVVAVFPSFTGAAVNPYYIVALVGVFLFGLLIYEISFHYQKRRGIDLSLRYKQIPPE